jgi:hypothetical protein
MLHLSRLDITGVVLNSWTPYLILSLVSHLGNCPNLVPTTSSRALFGLCYVERRIFDASLPAACIF